MRKVLALRKSLLTNGAHYDFMGIFLKDILEKAPEPVKTAVAPAMPAFNAAIKREYDWLEWAKISVLTKEIYQADKELDRVVRAIGIQIKASTFSVHSDIAAAATRVKTIYDSYGYIPRLKYEEEATAVTLLLGHLKTDLHADAVKAGLNSWIAILETALKNWNTLYERRAAEQGNKPIGTLRGARTVVDTAYAGIVTLLEAGTLTTNEALFRYVIGEINDEIGRLNAKYSPSARKNMSAAQVSSIPDQEYTGKPITPTFFFVEYPQTDELTVRLELGKDYNISYKDNINVGNAYVIIHGIGHYRGRKTLSFNILPAPVPDDPDCTCGYCRCCLERKATAKARKNKLLT